MGDGLAIVPDDDLVQSARSPIGVGVRLDTDLAHVSATTATLTIAPRLLEYGAS